MVLCGAHEHLCDIVARAYQLEMSVEHCRHYVVFLVVERAMLIRLEGMNCDK